jgi:hypothetical protein
MATPTPSIGKRAAITHLMKHFIAIHPLFPKKKTHGPYPRWTRSTAETISHLFSALSAHSAKPGGSRNNSSMKSVDFS